MHRGKPNKRPRYFPNIPISSVTHADFGLEGTQPDEEEMERERTERTVTLRTPGLRPAAAGKKSLRGKIFVQDWLSPEQATGCCVNRSSLSILIAKIASCEQR